MNYKEKCEPYVVARMSIFRAFRIIFYVFINFEHLHNDLLHILIDFYIAFKISIPSI